MFSLDTRVLRFRTFVGGALGMYNSIVVKDLNADGQKEVYLAGSLGIFRFNRVGGP